jgi:hypothetical protein
MHNPEPSTSTPAIPTRMPYVAPQLVEYGSVASLTQQPTPTPTGTPGGSGMGVFFEEF